MGNAMMSHDGGEDADEETRKRTRTRMMMMMMVMVELVEEMIESPPR